MIIRDDEIQGRFKDLLNTHTRVDIATAWATRGEHLRMLKDATKQEQRRVAVRAIVGISGNATRPDALEELYGITNGDIRIISGGGRLFHPKLYLFGQHTNGHAGSHAWIGSANFTNAAFGGHAEANEELIVETGPGKTTDALAAWFHERWNRCPTVPSVKEVIRRYTEDWKQNPPDPDFREFVSGGVSHRSDLLDDAHHPLTLQEYRQALEKCEEMLQDEEKDWEIFNPRGRSYMRAISERQQLLLGEARWSQLDDKSQCLKGGIHRGDSDWWGLLGRMARSNWKAVRDHEARIRRILDNVVSAEDTEFPDVAVAAMQELTSIDKVAHGTATLLLALARPDRLLSLNSASQRAYGKLSGMSPSTLGEPQNYRKLLQWLYAQPWYADSPPTDGALERIWRFRAALVDAFVYERP
jgi:HKD family nuclease